MHITITIKDKEKEEEIAQTPPPQAPPFPPLEMKLDIRKAVDGSLMIFDHPEMDLVVVPKTGKVVSFPKNAYTDDVYAAQNKFFDHLFKAGVITPGTIEGGNVHGAMGAIILSAEDSDFPAADLVVLSIAKFIEKEKPHYLFADAYEKEVEDMFVEPTEEDSTPLGKVPAAVKKGTIQPYDTRRYLSGYA